MDVNALPGTCSMCEVSNFGDIERCIEDAERYSVKGELSLKEKQRIAAEELDEAMSDVETDCPRPTFIANVLSHDKLAIYALEKNGFKQIAKYRGVEGTILVYFRTRK